MRKLFIILCACVGFVTLAPAIASARSSVAPGDTANVKVETIPGQHFDEVIEQQAKKSWPWYVIRASGIVAAITLAALMLSGIGSVTGHFFKVLEPLTAWATRRAMGIMFVAAIAIHMLTLLVDHYAPFTIAELLVPFASDLKPVTLFGINFGSLFVALGIFAFYGSLLIMITSLIWIDTKPRLWKWLHYVSYLVVAMVAIHGLYLGTDISKAGGVPWLITLGIVAIFIVIRLRRVGST